MAFQRRENPRTNLQPDRENEENQAKLTREFQHVMIYRQPEMRADQSGKQDAGHSQADPHYPQVPQRQPGRDDHRNGNDRVSDRIFLIECD